MHSPARPLRLDHIAFYTRSARATTAFWTNVMKCKLSAAISSPDLGAGRLHYPYLHVFFELADGSQVAFFELPDAGDEMLPDEPFRSVNHLALHVDSVDELRAWSGWLAHNGLEVRGPVDHGIILSIYFADPTSNCRLELATALARVTDADAADAGQSLDRWDAMRDEAARLGMGFSDLLRARLPKHGKVTAFSP